MNAMMTSLRNENGGLRGLTGSGEPGLYTVLGGTATEQDAEGLRLMGGAGQVSSASRLAQAHRDIRLAAVASGQPVPGTPGGIRGESGEPTPPTQQK